MDLYASLAPCPRTPPSPHHRRILPSYPAALVPPKTDNAHHRRILPSYPAAFVPPKTDNAEFLKFQVEIIELLNNLGLNSVDDVFPKLESSKLEYDGMDPKIKTSRKAVAYQEDIRDLEKILDLKKRMDFIVVPPIKNAEFLKLEGEINELLKHVCLNSVDDVFPS